MEQLIYGHRGAPAELPENTLPSFERALQTGAQALETDAQLTSDGKVILFHDPTGERVAGVKKAVANTSLQEIRTWDVGWGWRAPQGERPYVGKGFQVPLLEEVAEAFPGVLLNIDAKTPEVALPLLRTVQRLRLSEQVRIASFSQRILYHIRDAGWTGRLGIGGAAVAALRLAPEIALRPRRFSGLSWRPLDGDAVQIPVRQSGLRFDREWFLRRAHRLGLRVDFWTIDDPAEAIRLRSLGADGIVTNHPAAVSRPFFGTAATKD